jgi:AraC family transcriptional regulator of adaptative response/methylated-DNA-[protein]-cysteine methyltransferase
MTDQADSASVAHSPADLSLAHRAADLIDARIAEGAEQRQVSLSVLAADLGTSPTRLQKAFSRVVGLSPWDYGAEKRAQAFRAHLKSAPSVTHAIYAAGYGSASRVYEQSGFLLGMSPASYARDGVGAQITFDIVDSALGRLLVATTAVGLCALTFGDDDAALIAALSADFARADRLDRDDVGLRPILEDVVNYLETGARPHQHLRLDVQGTAFQRRVWQALLALPEGAVLSYGELGQEMGFEQGQRAVARGCASNRVGLLIPCHRIVRSDGGLGGYRWGIKRKQRLLAMESARFRAKEGL